MNRKTILFTFGLFCVVGLWFVAVDRIRYEENCLDCQLGRTIRQVRVATAPVRASIEDRPSLLSMAAADLGAPCSHGQTHRWVAESRLGLVLLIHREEVLHPIQRPWYPPCARDAARALARDEPSLSSEFRSRVLTDHDWSYWTTIRDRLFDACPADQRPDVLAAPEPPPPAEPAAEGPDPPEGEPPPSADGA